jgi:O-acetyl-ADP-ribose deacetylase (regulator of RNase III)
MPDRFVIHTVGPVYRGRPEDRRLLANCYRNSLGLAARNKARSVAFPAISCGVYGYPIEDACRIAIETTLAFLTGNDRIQRVIFILFSKQDRRVYEDHITTLGRT